MNNTETLQGAVSEAIVKAISLATSVFGQDFPKYSYDVLLWNPTEKGGGYNSSVETVTQDGLESFGIDAKPIWKRALSGLHSEGQLNSTNTNTALYEEKPDSMATTPPLNKRSRHI